jgi:hypothetical protein
MLLLFDFFWAGFDAVDSKINATRRRPRRPSDNWQLFDPSKGQEKVKRIISQGN